MNNNKESAHEEENTNNITNTLSNKQKHGAIKNPQISSNTKRMTTISKKLENVEYLIKIEQKNKKNLEGKYEKQLQKVEGTIEKLEVELEQTLKELNEKEAKIFEIQKFKLEQFKEEISKYQNIYNEIDDKTKNVAANIQEYTEQECELYNQTFMIYEDYLAFNNEISMMKKKIIELKESLTGIESTYPKEFQFLVEDIQLEKEINEISCRKKQFNEDVLILENSKTELVKLKVMKQSEILNANDDVKKIEAQIITAKNENLLLKMEDHIVKNINDMMLFEKMKIIVQNYYSQKNFDLENEVNVLLIKNLNEKLKEMKNEFVGIKNLKLLEKNKLEKNYEDMKKFFDSCKDGKSAKDVNKVKISKDIAQQEKEIEKLNNEINILELNCKKKETLFNKYIIVIRNKCKKSAQESYYEMNPSLIIETEFDEKFKEEVIKCIDNDEKLSSEDKIKSKNIVDIYFNELNNREKTIQSLIQKKKKYEENIETFSKELNKMSENLSNCENEISFKKKVINDLASKLKILLEKIETRNRNLTNNLEGMGEADFEKYLKSNEGVLKSMKKLYGNKIIDKVFKVQKQKFLENVILDHSFKKGKVNEFVQFITKYEQNLEYYNTSMNELEQSYQSFLRRYEELVDFQRMKEKERTILEESNVDLREKMENILSTTLKESEIEKRQLQFKYNVNFYIEKIKDISSKLDEYYYEKNKLTAEYDNFKNAIHEKEHKLYIEDLDLKNNLISLSMGMNEENNPVTVIPYKVNTCSARKSFREATSKGEESDPEKKEKELGFEDTVKRSLNEFNIKGPSVMDDLIMNRGEEENLGEDKGKSYKSMYLKKKDPFQELTAEKLRPLLNGQSLYKKFNNNSFESTGKLVFDPFKADDTPPENCGYALRLFQINSEEETLEIKALKTKHIEMKIPLGQIKGMLQNSVSKLIIKQRKSQVLKPNQEISQLLKTDYIQFMLLYADGKIDLIAPNYLIYKTFEAALEEILNNKKKLYEILKYAQ